MRRYERCNYCDVPMTWVSMLPRRPQRPRDETIDHIWPTSRGGTNHGFNRIKACRKCNFEKANKTLAEWIVELRDANDPRLPFVTKVLEDNPWTLLTQFTPQSASSVSPCEDAQIATQSES